MKTSILNKQASGQGGFSAHALIALVLVVGVISFAGYTVYQRANTGTTPSEVVLQPDVPATIRTKADLDQTATAVSKAGDTLTADLDTSSLATSIKQLQ